MTYAYVSTKKYPPKFTVAEEQDAKEADIYHDNTVYGTFFIPTKTQSPEVLLLFGIQPREHKPALHAINLPITNLNSQIQNYQKYATISHQKQTNNKWTEIAQYPKSPTHEPEYGLVFTGTQRINTGIKGSSNLRVIVDVIQDTIPPSPTYTDVPLFGSRVAMHDRTWCYWQQVSLQIRTDYDNTQVLLDRSHAPFNQRLIIDKDKNVTKINETVIHTAPATPFTNEIDLYLGNVGTSAQHANNFRGTMYSCKIYDTDILVRNFVPVPQGDTTYSTTPAPSNCMWDKITQQYFENVGTNTFEIT